MKASRMGSAPADRVQAMIDALSSPVRREILWLVWDTERPAGEIAAAFDLTAGTISTHLAALRNAGLVTMRRDGNFRRYRADRAATEGILPLLRSAPEKWVAADDITETEKATTTTALWVTVTVDVPVDQPTAFQSFLDGDRFSQWLGVPVTIDGRRFATELEWGTQVRGRYEVVAAPDLIALRWDFDDRLVPVPGRQLVGYVRFQADGAGCRVEVHQYAADREQAEFLSVAWSLVLGRLKQFTEHDHRASASRGPRPKRRGIDGAK